MRRTVRSGIACRFSSIVCSLLLGSALTASAQEEYVCVWRNPERTMTRIFANAADYRTVNAPISPAERTTIEKILGYELLPGQRTQFQYFEMLGKDGSVIGTIIASTQKGEFGAVEFVFGINPTGTISGIYVQRSRERNNQFKERDFLDLFVGKKAVDSSRFAALYTGEKSHGTTAVITGLRNELVKLELLRGEAR